VPLKQLIGVLALVLAVVAGNAQLAAAQTVTTADIQRLEDSIDSASQDVEQVRVTNSATAARLEEELDDVRDETTYLRVKARKNEPIARGEYTELRDRIEDIRRRARGDRASAVGGTVDGESDADIPVGTELDVRLQTPLSSKTALVEDRFEATTMIDLRNGERMLIPAGSVLRGVVSSVNKAGRVERQGKLTLAFDRLTINGRNYPIRATVTEALESEGIRGEVGKIGAGAGIGAIIGGIIGGVKGAITGILIGAGGTIAATEGSDVELPAGTVLRIRVDTPLDLR
jgi:hypothetical protein